ncbi:hypothetical protein [Haliangium sp.]|uniref:hypothetical protein n=1 Tax=Haliangium sp. TaxID=2663208 RepID=UPI003D138970
MGDGVGELGTAGMSREGSGSSARGLAGLHPSAIANEQRHSLAAIVAALHVQPSEVRALYHEWRISLERGEQGRRDAAPPQTTLTVPQRELAKRLAALPTDGSVRLSLAREGQPTYSEDWNRIAIFDELTGFTVEQAVSARQLREQCGPGAIRVTAYSLAEQRTLWEVIAEIS